MKSTYNIIVGVLFILLNHSGWAQSDSVTHRESTTIKTQTIVKKKSTTDTVLTIVKDTTVKTILTPTKKKFYQTRLFKATIVPAALIGYGVSTIHGNGLISSYDVYDFINNDLNFKGTDVDDYLQYAPYAELVLLNLLKIKCKNDIINTSLLIVKSELIMLAMVYPLKYLTGIVRPDSVEPGRNHSFPSGHTANAFVAASIVHKEFKHRSPWYGIGAYTIAASVGVFRMLNNRHWQADVFAGAGFGMLAVHLAYLTHKNKFGRKCDLFAMPTYNNRNFGFALVKNF